MLYRTDPLFACRGLLRAVWIRIALDKGVCGAAARLRATQRVDDVHAFPGHIACDADSRSELVVPVIANDRLGGVLDLDSPSPARFTAADQAGAEADRKSTRLNSRH